MGRALGDAWDALSDEKKARFEAMYKREKEEYDVRAAEF